MHQIICHLGLRPDFTAGVYSAPQTLQLYLWGLTSKESGKGKGSGKGRRGRAGMERKVKGGKGNKGVTGDHLCG